MSLAYFLMAGFGFVLGLALLAFLVSGWFVWALQLDHCQRFAGATIAGGAMEMQLIGCVLAALLIL